MACAVAVRDMAAAVNTVCGVGVLVIKKVGVTVGVWMVAKAVATTGWRIEVDLPVAVGVGVDDGVAIEDGTGDGMAVRVGISDGVAVRVGTSDGEGAVDSSNGSAVSVARPALPGSVYHVYHRLERNMSGPLDMTIMQTPNTTPKVTEITATRLSIARWNVFLSISFRIAICFS